MEWTRSETLCLASNQCAVCGGMGLTRGRNKGIVPCGCVTRTIFRICFARFQDCAVEDIVSSPSLEHGDRGSGRRYLWSRKNAEYMADFMLIAKRTLDPLHFNVFRMHFLLGAGYRICGRRLNMDKGTFFHAVYRVEQRLGKAFRETEPYGLFPLDEYFGGPSRLNLRGIPAMTSGAVVDDETLEFRAGGPLRAPLRAVRGEG